METKLCGNCGNHLTLDNFTLGKRQCKKCRRNKANINNNEMKLEEITLSDERKKKRREYIKYLYENSQDTLKVLLNVFIEEEDLIKIKNDRIKIYKLPKKLFKMIKDEYEEEFENGYIRDIIGLKIVDPMGKTLSYSIKFII